MRYYKANIIDMKKCISVNTRHAIIDLGNYEGCLCNSSLNYINAHPETHEAMLVRRRCLDEGNIDGNHTPPDKPWHLRKKYGRIITFASVNCFASILTNEKSTLTKISFESSVCIGGYPETPDMKDLSIEKRFGI